MCDFAFYLFIVIVLMALIYLAPRLASIAYFRSKAEYDRLQRRRLLNGDHNAKE